MPRSILALSPHILFSQFRGPFPINMADDGAGGDDADGDKDDGDKGDGDNGDKGDKKQKLKPDDTEGRITVLAKEKKDLEDKLAKIEADKKAAEEAKMKEDGKLKELLDAKEKELAELAGSSNTMKTKLEAYEKMATEQVDNTLKAITDKEKQKIAKEMLEGKPVEEQIQMLPKIIALTGVQATSFGGPTPTSTSTPDQKTIDAKKARFQELVKKTTKGEATPAERQEKHRLSIELSKELEKEAEAKKTT